MGYRPTITVALHATTGEDVTHLDSAAREFAEIIYGMLDDRLVPTIYTPEQSVDKVKNRLQRFVESRGRRVTTTEDPIVYDPETIAPLWTVPSADKAIEHGIDLPDVTSTLSGRPKPIRKKVTRDTGIELGDDPAWLTARSAFLTMQRRDSGGTPTGD